MPGLRGEAQGESSGNACKCCSLRSPLRKPPAQPPRAFRHPLPLLVAQHSQPGTARGHSNHTGQLQNPGSENSHSTEEKNQTHTWKTGCSHHIKTKNKAAFSPAFGCFSYNNRANSLCARLTVSGPGRSLALLSRQAQVCTTALPKWEAALKTWNSSPSPAAEQLSCFPQVPGFISWRLCSGPQHQAAPSPHSNARRFCFSQATPLIPWSHLSFHTLDGC